MTGTAIDPLDPDAPPFDAGVRAADYATAAARWRRLCEPAVAWHVARRPFSAWWSDRRGRSVARRFGKDDIATIPAHGEVCIVGAFGGRNGVSRAARYDLAGVLARYPAATVVDVSRRSEGALQAYAASRRQQPPALIIFLLQPDAVLRHLDGLDPAFLRSAYRIALGVWEVPCFPARWRHADRFLHEYWTPSRFAAQALSDDGGTRRVSVIPHDVLGTGDPHAAEPAGDGTFRGLAVMDLTVCPDRKNPWAHIEAWRKAFGRDARFVLTIKARFSARTTCIAREMRAMIGDGADIRLLEAELSDAAMLDLQRSSHVGLSLHRSEGFGLTIGEMLAIGRPMVATGWSGNMEFMADHPLAHAVRFSLVPYRDYLARYPEYQGTWAEADTGHAAFCLRAVARAAAERPIGSGQATGTRPLQQAPVATMPPPA